jgi:hypothetical protein
MLAVPLVQTPAREIKIAAKIVRFHQPRPAGREWLTGD